MPCPRCGAAVDGPFCPVCGTPAVAPPGSGRPCPRCGAPVDGAVCPRCGLPAAAYLYPPPPPASGGRSLLSILWTVAVVAFLLFAVLDYAGLFLAPAFVVPGIEDIRGGSTLNPDFDVSADGWAFSGYGSPPAQGSHQAVGGNLDGFLETTLPSADAIGYWTQAFLISGSEPHTGYVQLDVDVTLGPNVSRGILLVHMSPSPGVPGPGSLAGSVSYEGRTPWQETPRIPVGSAFSGPGTYYVSVGFALEAAPGLTSSVVGFDNVRLRWSTDAALYFYVAVPDLVVVYVTQDPGLFLAYYVLLIAVVTAAGAYHAFADRRDLRKAFAAPLREIGLRLRTRSAWITIGQVWAALTFFQVAVVLLLALLRYETSTPIVVTDRNVWVYLYELLNASVYEEVVFRVLLMGAPLAFGSLVARVLELNRSGGSGRGQPGAGRYLTGSLRYLVGGNLRGTSTKEALLAAWAVLLGSAAIFGFAHAPSWGLWKVVPSFVAGLAFGYLFLRHGFTAAILAHFVNDYASSLIFMGAGGDSATVLVGLLFLGLVVAGAGFFVWYSLYVVRQVSSLVSRFTGRPVRRLRVTSLPPPYAPPPPGAPPRPPPMAASYSPPSGARAPWDAGTIPPDYIAAYHAPPYGYPPVRFQCPACGWVEARYEGGRFTCTRCGRTA